MSNQAFSEASDLMVGAGGLYFRRDQDQNELHFLGNCTQFNITTDVTKVEKFSSMNKKRELMATVTTQTKATGSIVLNEYNMYNLALGLYGTEHMHSQAAVSLAGEPFTVPSVPGIVELKDSNGERYVNVTGVTVAPATPTPADAQFAASADVDSTGHIYTQPGAGNGGTVTVNGAGYTGTTTENYVFRITTAPTAAGDLDGMVVEAAANLLDLTSTSGTYQTVTVSTTTTTATVTVNGVTITFDVTAGNSFSTTGVMTFTVTPSVSTYEEGKDYILEDEAIRGGLIKIKKGGRISGGDTILVTATVPAGDFVTVSGSDAGKITGSLLFIGDPNQGNVLMLEAWNCSISPEGDLTGLISDDFGEFTLTVDIQSDYQNHPKYPLYKITKLGEAVDPLGTPGEFDPDE